MVTVVFFSTSNCRYCQPINTYIDNIKDKYKDTVTFTKLIVDKDPSALKMAKEWNIRAVPAIIFIVDEKEQYRLVGDISQEKIIDGIERYLQPDVLPEPS